MNPDYRPHSLKIFFSNKTKPSFMTKKSKAKPSNRITEESMDIGKIKNIKCSWMNDVFLAPN